MLTHHPEKEEYREKNSTRIERPDMLLKTKQIIKGEKSSIKHAFSNT